MSKPIIVKDPTLAGYEQELESLAERWDDLVEQPDEQTEANLIQDTRRVIRRINRELDRREPPPGSTVVQ